jgi:(E)-4-hydroxy-3-methylbut-2-enyl-diphosphate synthase
MEIKRRKSRVVEIGNVKIGGDHPIAIQSMTKTHTAHVEKTIEEIHRLEEAGCDIVRVAVPDRAAARAISEIKKQIRIPLVADIHFFWELGIEAIEAGADKIRLNPGNLQRKEHVVQIAKKANAYGIPIRVGINAGSVFDKLDYVDFLKKSRFERSESVVQKMVGRGRVYLDIFEESGFDNIVVSLKTSDVRNTYEAYTSMAPMCNYPFHLGITEAGFAEAAVIKSSIGVGSLLLNGIGDTIRVSLTEDPVHEVHVAKKILKSLGLAKGHDIISCPSCGRCDIDLFGLVRKIEEKVESREKQAQGNGSGKTKKGYKLAIMGCEVNGPGESRQADLGLAAGKDSALLFRKGEVVRRIKGEENFVDAFMEELDVLDKEEEKGV